MAQGVLIAGRTQPQRPSGAQKLKVLIAVEVLRMASGSQHHPKLMRTKVTFRLAHLWSRDPQTKGSCDTEQEDLTVPCCWLVSLVRLFPLLTEHTRET